mgnify:CR=1 FL=1
MTPMDIAFQLLKRQTTLGEFHPDFPSPYGPVTMRRHHPTQAWYDKLSEVANSEHAGETLMGDDYDKKLVQPAENLITEGLKQQPSNRESDVWELMYQGKMKPFNLAGKGTWVHPAGMKGGDSMNSQDRQHIGIRMPLKDVQGQFRNRAAQDEGPEAWVNQDIPPERLVNLPDWWTAQRPVTWGKRGE